ncbi:MAG TPA: endo-1,4-beta-xylanase [Alphaproteobacteria bacterium]|nr:endo-1,4-beta-xylanase [Alphaproteobacteria bacterium]
MLSRRSFLAAAGVAACAPLAEPVPDEAVGLDALAAAKGLRFGAALQPRHFADAAYVAVVRRETGVIVGENAQKWHVIARDAAPNYAEADALAGFAAVNGLRLRGHALLWYLHVPTWWEQLGDRAAAERAMLAHLERTVSRYRGRIASWDVVNEAIEPADGRNDGLRRAVFLDRFGDGYLQRAFAAARNADPTCQLVYNDYGFEYATRWHERRRRALLDLLARFRRDGTPIDAVGLQSHLVAGQAFDAALWRRFLAEIAAMNYRIVVTELDVTDAALPADIAARDAGVADEYRRFLDATLDEPAVEAVLTWGLTDRWSWLRSPAATPQAIRRDGAAARPLPFDDALRRKPAWSAIARAFAAAPARPRA